MNLVILYGLPAVGKLTVASALSRLTGYGVFHNHLTTDLARSLFPVGREPYAEFCDELRYICFEAAATHDLPGLIFTFCYGHADDDPFLDRVEEIVARRDGRVCYIHLSCTREAIEKRVTGNDRARFGKLTDMATWDKSVATMSPEPMPGRESLKLDNTRMTPEEAARRIADYLKEK